jgi:hypothetical protein
MELRRRAKCQSNCILAEALFGGVNRFCGTSYEGNNVLTKIGSNLRVVAKSGKAARSGEGAPVLRQGFGVSRNGLACIPQRLVDIISSRKTAGEVRKPNTRCGARSCILQDCNIGCHVMLVRLPICLLIDLAHKTHTQVLPGMRQHDNRTARWMAKDMVRASDPLNNPTILF